LAFNTACDLDLALAHTDTWETVCARLPTDCRPDFIVLYLPYSSIPACLWSAPVPIIGLAADWNLLWHHYRSALRRCDLILTDAAGVEVMHREGILQARPAVLYGYGQDWEEESGSKFEDGSRDIDVLFVGNLHPAVQRRRLKWLGRLGSHGERWNVQIHTGVFGREYRKLLRRARIVFNRGIRGEANQRVFEAAAAGALLFQEQGNLEVPQFFRDRQECIYYNDSNLEALLDYYLEHEEERRTIAEAGQARASECSFEKLWSQQLGLIEDEWPNLLQVAAKRNAGPNGGNPLSVLERTWQAISSSHVSDPGLASDLAAELVQHSQDANLHNALGLTIALADKGPGPVTSTLTQKVIGYFQRAVENDPIHLMAGLNLVESLAGLNQKQPPIDQAKNLLARIADSPWRLCDAAPDWVNAGHFPPAFDLFRVEWERAAWTHAGNPAGEIEAKQCLLRWRLHLLLAELTGDLHHYYEAVLARPDLPNSQAALGCALGRAGQLQESADHLRFAVAENPFDLEAARALQQVLQAQEATDSCRRLARDRRRLARIAPKAVPAEGWFMETPPVGDELASIIILCCNELEYTRQCLESVLQHTRQPYELILINNGSTDGTSDYLEDLRQNQVSESIKVI
jgi:tetratricopeptide (TPR) repeat protein